MIKLTGAYWAKFIRSSEVDEPNGLNMVSYSVTAQPLEDGLSPLRLHENFVCRTKENVINAVGIQRLQDLAKAYGVEQLEDTDQIAEVDCVLIINDKGSLNFMSLDAYKRKQELTAIIEGDAMTPEELRASLGLVQSVVPNATAE